MNKLHILATEKRMRYQKLVSVNEVTIVMEVWKLWWNFHGET